MNRASPTIFRAQGLTVLELLVCLTIVGTAAFVAAPLLTAPREALRFTRVRTQFIAAVEEQILRALLDEQQRSITIHRSGWELKTPSKTQRIELPPQISFDLPQEHTILIAPKGYATPTRVTLRNSRTRCTIIVSLRGRIRSNCEELR